MKDRFGREIDYLRISVTDLCNLRCQYCMPSNGVEKFSHDQIISVERIQEIVQAAASIGIKKVRLTGGEPLVRKGIIEIIRSIRSIPEIQEICLTTNGVTLKECAKELKNAGVNRLNISLDTLDEEKYHRITRNGHLQDVLNGIKEARRVGFQNIKINCVLIRGFNDDEIEKFVAFAGENDLNFRFIELMPIGQGATLGPTSFVPNSIVLEKVPNLIPCPNADGVSSLYQIPHSKGYIGLISPLSNKFCDQCSRLRLTSDGKIKPCLHSKQEIDLNGLHGGELIEALRQSILAKPERHYLNEEGISKSLRSMNKIGG